MHCPRCCDLMVLVWNEDGGSPTAYETCRVWDCRQCGAVMRWSELGPSGSTAHADERAGFPAVNEVLANNAMGMTNAAVEAAILNMLRRYEILMMEDLIIARPDYSREQLFLAVDRLSRNNLISLRLMNLSYQMCLINPESITGFRQRHEEPVAPHR